MNEAAKTDGPDPHREKQLRDEAADALARMADGEQIELETPLPPRKRAKPDHKTSSVDFQIRKHM